MKTKQNIYVAVANKKQAKQFKAILKGLGEVTFSPFYDADCNYLIWDDIEGHWVCLLLSLDRSEITIKELIELLVSGKIYNKAFITKIPNKKIAVRVENESQFKALMNYYDSLGWKQACTGCTPLKALYHSQKEVQFNDDFYSVCKGSSIESFAVEGYEVVHFSHFSLVYNIQYPLAISTDGVEMLLGSECHWVYEHEGKYYYNNRIDFAIGHAEIINTEPKVQFIFSTKEEATDWVEKENRPDQIVLFADEEGCEVIVRNDGSISVDKIMVNKGHIGITFPKDNVDKIIEAYKSLRRGGSCAK